MRNSNALPGMLFVITFGTGLAIAYSAFAVLNDRENILIAVSSFILAALVAYSTEVADQWERVVGLRLVVTSTAVVTMRLGGLAGMTALSASPTQDRSQAPASGLWSDSSPPKS